MSPTPADALAVFGPCFAAPCFDHASFRSRRDRFAARVGGTPALIAAGAAPSRNYPAATYPFRASSHFLYLVGLPLPNAMLFFDGRQFRLFAPPPTTADALWHGPGLGLDDLASATGLDVQPLAELDRALGRDPVGTVSAPDAATRRRQSELLGRNVGDARSEASAGDGTTVDRALASALVELRLHHDDAAVAGLRRAAAATVQAHRAGLAATMVGRRESDVRAAMESALMAEGMQTAYGSIVTVHGEVLHNDAHHGILGAGDLLLVDVGAETADGWAGDVTRTWPVSGRFSGTQRDFYDVVLAAQRAAIAAVRPGARYRDIHLCASETLATGMVELGILRGDAKAIVADGGHALLFPHGIGHLLGLDVHDMEDLGDLAGYPTDRQRSEQFGLSYLRLDRDLSPGMAVTIEPGLYVIPALLGDPAMASLAARFLDRDRLATFQDVRGIRIEDDVLVTSDGHEVLTSSLPTEAEAIEALVGRG